MMYLEGQTAFAEVDDYNPRSFRAFEKVGFELCDTLAQQQGSRGRNSYDLALTRESYGSQIP